MAAKNTNIAAAEKEAPPDAHDRIYTAAETLFVARGYDAVSLSDIATEAGVAKGLILYYFKNKQLLFESVLDDYYHAQAQTLLGAMGAGSVRERLHKGIDAYLDFIETHPGIPRLIQREICTDERHLNKIVQYMEPLHLWGTEVFGKKLPAKGPKSPKHLFLSIFGMIVNYYTYAPVVRSLWGADPMSPAVLAERREHIHWMTDALMDKLDIDQPGGVAVCQQQPNK